MFKLNDIADLFCISRRTIERRIKIILPILHKFKPNTRKHLYNLEEVKNIIKFRGTPPENENTRQIRDKFPDLFK
jgi:predicted DNA-binding protein YlxM (UPF0122 family)